MRRSTNNTHTPSTSVKSTTTAGVTPTPGDGSRIPKTLQAVFLASNRGNDVDKPPPKQVAFRTFFRSFLGKKKDPKETTKENNNNNKKSKETTKVENSYKKSSKNNKNDPMRPPKPVKKVRVMFCLRPTTTTFM